MGKDKAHYHNLTGDNKMVDLDAIKRANPIQDVIEKDEPLRAVGGRYWRGVHHDSLVVDVEAGTYYWNSKNESGDVIEWVQRRRGMDFKAAVEWLAERAGLPEPNWGKGDASRLAAIRVRENALTVAARWFEAELWKNEKALEYAKGRGWTADTIRSAHVGFAPDDRRGLFEALKREGFDAKSPVVRAVMGIPAGMLIYPHWRGGKVEYLAGRSIEGKRHYNLPRELVGGRKPYFNHVYSPFSPMVLIVEGQADAISLAQLGVAAVALAGTAISEALKAQLRRHAMLVLALDADDAGDQAVDTIADELPPTVRILRWVDGKDANDFLVRGGTLEALERMVENAPIWPEVLAARVAGAPVAQRETLLRRVFDTLARMDDFALAKHRQGIAKILGINLRQFNAMLKAAKGEVDEAEDSDVELETVHIPGGLVGDHLLEMIARPGEGSQGIQAGWRTEFACRCPDGSIRIIPHLDVDGVRYAPIPPESRIITERVVQFPNALGKKLSASELVKLVRRTIHKYVDVPEFYEALASYYVLFTWLYDSFNTLPYLRVLGDAGTGKSRFIQTVGALCYRPIFVMGAATVSPIFRILDRYRGTLVFDEADFGQSDEKAEIVKILNAGYQRAQGTVLRTGDRNTGFEPEVFVVYSPKVIATRRKFQDWALESRCLTYETGGPTTRDDIPIEMPMEFWEKEAPEVRSYLLRYRLEYWKPHIELDYSDVDMSLEPRLNQVTVALMTLIKDAELRKSLVGFIQEYNRQLIVERGMTLTAKVLEALVGIHRLDQSFSDNPDPITLKRLAKGVNALIDAENATDEDEEEEEQKRSSDKRITPRKVGDIVRRQLHLRTERSSAAKRAYVVVWDEKRIEALRKRFGLASDEDLVGTAEILLAAEV